MKPAKAIEILRGSTDMTMMPDDMKEAIETVCNERAALVEMIDELFDEYDSKGGGCFCYQRPTDKRPCAACKVEALLKDIDK